MADTQTRSTPQEHRRPAPRLRPWIALAAAAIAFALIPLGILPVILAMPLVGLALAFGAPPDHLGNARPIAGGRRNTAPAVAVILAVAVVVFDPQLKLPLVQLFGLYQADFAVVVLAVVALALPLAMADGSTRIDDLPADRFVLTRRNLILSLTVMLTVAVWYFGPGLSFAAIGLLVLCVPWVLVVTRILAARRRRLRLDLWRRPLQPGLGRHRLQWVNVLLLCLLLAATLFTGAYDRTALGLSVGGYRTFQWAFLAGLLTLVALAVLPLARVRVGSNLLVIAGSLFMAAQLVLIYRPAANPVTIASPLAGEWFVGQGGHSELVNYHHVGSTQSDALDIEQVVDGSTHRPDGTGSSSYYIYDQPVLAPADAVVTWVLDGRPDLPIGSADSHYQAGNQVVLDIGGNRYLMIGHLRPGSVQVKVGDRVRVGQQIARVGNSGNTTEPHIHIQAQTLPTGIGDVATLDGPKILRTLHTYPLVFRDVVLTRGGVQSRPAAADPRRGDLVRPIN